MKHAILIIAYHHKEYVRNLVEQFDGDFAIFIHWDKKQDLSDEDIAYLEGQGGKVHVRQEFPVNWGSYGIVRATLCLCKEALKDKEVRYLHLISDADAPTVGLATFKKWFREHEGENFLEYEELPIRSWEHGGWERIRYFHRLERFDIRANPDDDRAYNEDLARQKAEGRGRELPDIRWYGGSAWWSLTRECASYLVGQEKRIEETFTDMKFPDELFAQTVLMNSPYARTLVNDNLRYIFWGWRNGNNPAVLDHTDLLGIAGGRKFFARKIDPVISKTLLQGIEYLRRNEITAGLFAGKGGGLDEVAHYLQGHIDSGFSGGLGLGNAGAALFLQAYGQAAGQDLHAYVDKAAHYAERELATTDDPGYETGKMGIAVGLECLLGDARIGYGRETFAQLDRINRKLLNFLLNYAGNEMPEKLCRYCAAYFFARERGNRLTPTDRSVRQFLQSKFPLPTDAAGLHRTEWNHTVGLAGYAGYGLQRLAEEGQIDKRFIILLIPDKEK